MYIHGYSWMFTILSSNSEVSVLTGFLRAYQLIPDQMWTICFGCRRVPGKFLGEDRQDPCM
jgi:hypothetical protein